MSTIRVSYGSWDNPSWRRASVVARRGHVVITRRPGYPGLYDVTHAPTGLDVHPRLQGISLCVAKRALPLCAALGDRDWTDRNGVRNMPPKHNRSLWDALAVIAEMAAS